MPSPQGSRCELSYRDETFWLSRVDRSKVPPEWSEVSDEELIGAELDLTLHGRMPRTLPRTSASMPVWDVTTTGTILVGALVAIVSILALLVMGSYNLDVWVSNTWVWGSRPYEMDYVPLSSFVPAGVTLVLGAGAASISAALFERVSYSPGETVALLSRAVQRWAVPADLLEVVSGLVEEHEDLVASEAWRSGLLDASVLGFDPDEAKDEVVGQIGAYLSLRFRAGSKNLTAASSKALAELRDIIESNVSMFERAREEAERMDRALQEQADAVEAVDVSAEAEAEIAAALRLANSSRADVERAAIEAGTDAVKRLDDGHTLGP